MACTDYGRKYRVAVCECKCGVRSVVMVASLKCKPITCHACRIGKPRAKQEQHGYSRTPTYKTWCGMNKRCYNPAFIDFHRYGGRGITVCDRWRRSFVNFLSDMGERPTLKHQLDRIDNDGPYSPENCRWVTAKQNLRNTSRNRFVPYRGKSVTIAELSEVSGVDYFTLRKRIFQNGWTPETAATTPWRQLSSERN